MNESSQDCVEIGGKDILDSDQSEFELQKEDFRLLEQLVDQQPDRFELKECDFQLLEKLVQQSDFEIENQGNQWQNSYIIISDNVEVEVQQQGVEQQGPIHQSSGQHL